MILAVGATDLLGKEICRRLRGRQDRVRGLVRPGSPVEHELAALGVEIVHGDLKDASSIEVACRGVGVVVTTATCIASRRRGDTLRSKKRGQIYLLAKKGDRSICWLSMEGRK